MWEWEKLWEVGNAQIVSAALEKAGESILNKKEKKSTDKYGKEAVLSETRRVAGPQSNEEL